MDLLSLITACAISAHPGVVTTLYQVAQVHQGRSLVIEDVDRGLLYKPTTTAEAVGIATALVETGSHVRVGLGQINASVAMSVYGVSVGDLFDDCRNIAVAADQLTIELEHHRDIDAALAAYFDNDPTSPIGQSWASEVRAQPSPPPFGDPTSSPGRRYSIPGHRIFAHRSDSEHREPEPPASHQVIAEPESIQRNGDDADDETSAVEEQPGEASTVHPEPTLWPRPSEHNRRVRRKAQPSVTTERLPTSSEIQNDEEE